MHCTLWKGVVQCFIIFLKDRVVFLQFELIFNHFWMVAKNTSYYFKNYVLNTILGKDGENLLTNENNTPRCV